MAYTLHTFTEKQEMLPVFPLIQQLNTKISAEKYAHCLDDMLVHGYRMAVVMEGNRYVGVSGFWVITKLYSGKYMEMDNVVVDAAHRSQGIGKLMSDYLHQIAYREGCETMMLDAYLENTPAHAFYEREGFLKRGYHFIKHLDS